MPRTFTRFIWQAALAYVLVIALLALIAGADAIDSTVVMALGWTGLGISAAVFSIAERKGLDSRSRVWAGLGVAAGLLMILFGLLRLIEQLRLAWAW